MRKNLTLLIAGILLLATAGVAQAQAVYEVFSNAVTAREGGAAELSGNVVLFLRTGDHNSGVVTLQYSAPLAKGTVPMVTGGGSVAADEDENTVMITMPSSGDTTITLSDVRLDLREAEVPVTVTLSGDTNAFASGVSSVISAIRDALEVTSTSAQILTRGGMGSATVTLKEAFATAFTIGAEVKLTLVGVPDKASLTVSHVQPEDPDVATDDADVAGDVTLNADTMIVTDADTTVMELVMTGDGDKLNIIVGFTGPSATATESVNLMFELMATSDQDDLMLPLDEGVVEVWVTMAPDEAADTPDGSTTDEYFTVNYIPAAGVVAFTIAPASCTLLFPYAATISSLDWDTAIAVTNPSAFTDTPLDGTLTFTLFSNNEDMAEYSTDGSSPGLGLVDGSLPAGNTYAVLLSQILDAADLMSDFQGHIYVRTNFTGCRGVGWITNWTTVNQAYLPYFGDNLDEGDVPANQ